MPGPEGLQYVTANWFGKPHGMPKLDANAEVYASNLNIASEAEAIAGTDTEALITPATLSTITKEVKNKAYFYALINSC